MEFYLHILYMLSQHGAYTHGYVAFDNDNLQCLGKKKLQVVITYPVFRKGYLILQAFLPVVPHTPQVNFSVLFLMLGYNVVSYVSLVWTKVSKFCFNKTNILFLGLSMFTFLNISVLLLSNVLV